MGSELTTSCLSLHFGLPISYVAKWQLTHLWHVQDFLEKRWQTLDLEPGTSSSPCSFDTSCWASLMVWSVRSIRGLWFSSIPGFYKTAVKSSLEKVVMMSFVLLLVRGGEGCTNSSLAWAQAERDSFINTKSGKNSQVSQGMWGSIWEERKEVGAVLAFHGEEAGVTRRSGGRGYTHSQPNNCKWMHLACLLRTGHE